MEGESLYRQVPESPLLDEGQVGLPRLTGSAGQLQVQEALGSRLHLQPLIVEHVHGHLGETRAASQCSVSVVTRLTAGRFLKAPQL